MVLNERTAYCVQRILDFVGNHPESYASLAVCRRALDRGLEAVTSDTVHRLADYLAKASQDEVEAYYDIVG